MKQKQGERVVLSKGEVIDETFGFSRCVDQEGELGVVIGRTAKDVLRGKAKDYIVGYTCVNDVSERYAQKEDSQWAIDKGFDTFAPIGPWIETEIDPDDLKLETYLKGKLCQSARTSEPTFILCILQFVFSLNF